MQFNELLDQGLFVFLAVTVIFGLSKHYSKEVGELRETIKSKDEALRQAYKDNYDFALRISSMMEKLISTVDSTSLALRQELISQHKDVMAKLGNLKHNDHE